MGARLRRWMPLLKIVFTLVVLAGVAWFFVHILTSEDLRKTDPSRSPAQILWDEACAARPGDLALAAVLYLSGMAFSGLFWIGLLRVAGAPLSVGAGLRAYYISHLGKYTLGSGLPTVMRMSMASSAGVRPAVAALTAVYETLTTMAAGALVAAVLLVVMATSEAVYIWWALGLLVLAGVPTLPGVFNPLVRRLSKRFTTGQPLPRLPAMALPIGLIVTACGWALLGVSLYAVVRAVQPGPWTAGECLDCIAITGLSYVAGFASLMAGGFGVREVFLQQFLAHQFLDDTRALVVALLVRLLWTSAEVVAAGALFWLPVRRAASGEAGRVLEAQATEQP
ncbi:MAG TPA: lysylphosphatidylglycerol synthase domain-containing protein [Gemmataceae bacterium]|nr:lysylphosphatidylglycerol synthase domain-containing protein [Gemmataceae bacterium]